jgi:hypothetical protein
MNVRKTKVWWNPRYERLEYLDERGEPYYCEIKPCDDPAAADASEPPAATPNAWDSVAEMLVSLAGRLEEQAKQGPDPDIAPDWDVLQERLAALLPKAAYTRACHELSNARHYLTIAEPGAAAFHVRRAVRRLHAAALGNL